MFHINNYPIQEIDERCNLPTRKRLNQNITHNHQDLYGDTLHYKERFNDLGVPIFIVKLKDYDDTSDEQINIQQDGVISDELFDQLFDRVEIKPKSSSKKTKKKRNKKQKNK